MDAPGTDTTEEPAAPDRLEQATRTIRWALLGVQLVYLADVLTNGALHRAADPHWQRTQRGARSLIRRARREREIRRQVPWVIWDAHEALLEYLETGQLPGDSEQAA